MPPAAGEGVWLSRPSQASWVFGNVGQHRLLLLPSGRTPGRRLPEVGGGEGGGRAQAQDTL